MKITNEEIIEVLEKIKVFNLYKQIATDLKIESNKNNEKHLMNIEKKQSMLIIEIKSIILIETYFLFHQLYNSIERGDYERSEQLKNRILDYGTVRD